VIVHGALRARLAYPATLQTGNVSVLKVPKGSRNSIQGKSRAQVTTTRLALAQTERPFRTTGGVASR